MLLLGVRRAVEKLWRTVMIFAAVAESSSHAWNFFRSGAEFFFF